MVLLFLKTGMCRIYVRTYVCIPFQKKKYNNICHFPKEKWAKTYSTFNSYQDGWGIYDLLSVE